MSRHTNPDCFDPIVGVSIIYNGKQYNLPAPSRHHDVIRHIASVTGNSIKGPNEQGFYNARGHFLDRKFAMEVAKWNNQLKRDTTSESAYQGPELFSEDLW